MSVIRPARSLGALALVLSLGLLAACGSGSAGGADGGAAAGSGDGADGHFPVTIEHAFGATTITEEPERIVTIGWGTTDAVLAMEEVPVGIEEQNYGGGKDKVLPWVEQKLEEMGAETPVLLPTANQGTIDYEAILELHPDVILAQYSGITQDQYQKLSKMAPTVAYPEQPWSTSMTDIVMMTGKALGEPQEAREILARIEQRIQAAAEAHPEFQGLTIATLKAGTTQLYTYTQADPREKLLRDLGFTTAASVKRLSRTVQEGQFYVPFSFEKADQLTSDVLLVFSDSKQAHRAMKSTAWFRSMPQAKDDSVASVVGEAQVAAVSPPTALSLLWGLDELVRSLSKAAAQVG